jgi:hypothetical protein
MICSASTRRNRRQNGLVWNRLSISTPRGTLIPTLPQSTWRRHAIHRRARQTLQWPAPYSPARGTTPPLGARETWLEEREGRYPDNLLCGRAQRLLDCIWVFLLRRNLGGMVSRLQGNHADSNAECTIEVASGSIPLKTGSRRDLGSKAANTAERSMNWKEIRHYTDM